MPKLSEINKTVTRILPVSGVTVVLQDCLTFEQSDELENIKENELRGERTLIMIVKSWDLQDDDDSILPVSKESLYRLPTPDVKELFRYIMTDLVRPRSEADIKDQAALQNLADEAMKQAEITPEHSNASNPENTQIEASPSPSDEPIG
jgi:hypothetical protein